MGDNDSSSSCCPSSAKKRGARAPGEVAFLAGEACCYSVTRRSAQALGWTLVGEFDRESRKRNCHVVWIDRSFVSDKLFLSIQPWQRINHFPGMINICRKARLAQSLEVMRRQFPKEFSFYPNTYVLPHAYASFKTLFSSSGSCKDTFIVKPDGAAQGKGIFLTRRIEDVENLGTVCVAQQYIRNPLLIDRKKFDLRIYVLVTSCSPLRMYLFRDGLVRLCTEEYKRPSTSNIKDRCMHLTNYSVNKRSDKYERDEESTTNSGSKRSICWLLSWLSQKKGPGAAKRLWSRIGDISVLTVLSILPTLQREYAAVFNKALPSHEELPSEPQGGETLDDSTSCSRCFELLGIDIMIDSSMNPSLIEVNHLPSWATDSPVDEEIKSRVITQALRAINVDANDRRRYEQAKRKQSRWRLGGKQHRKQTSAADSAQAAPRQGHTTKPRPSNHFFESNSAHKKISRIYERHAPDKLANMDDLMARYRGYEEWLLMKIQEKYSGDNGDDENSASSSDDCERSEDAAADTDPVLTDAQRRQFNHEEHALEDYDRIYPPSEINRIAPERYRDMERFAAEQDAKQQKRLLGPLQQLRPPSDTDNGFNAQGHFSRGEWIGGNIHIRCARRDSKVAAPPTKKQVECLDRLSKGFSVRDEDIDVIKERVAKKRSRLLNHDLVYEDDNPFLLLSERVRQSKAEAQQARKLAEKKLFHRSAQKSGTVPIRQQVLGLDFPLKLLNEDDKYLFKKAQLFTEK